MSQCKFMVHGDGYVFQCTLEATREGYCDRHPPKDGSGLLWKFLVAVPGGVSIVTRAGRIWEFIETHVLPNIPGATAREPLVVARVVIGGDRVGRPSNEIDQLASAALVILARALDPSVTDQEVSDGLAELEARVRELGVAVALRKPDAPFATRAKGDSGEGQS